MSRQVTKKKKKKNCKWEKAFETGYLAWLKTGDVKLWTQTHGERKNRVQSFIKHAIISSNCNWIRLLFFFFKKVSSISNHQSLHSTVISISKSVSQSFFTHIQPFYFFPFTFILRWNFHVKLFSSSLIYVPINLYFSRFASIFPTVFHEDSRNLIVIIIYFFFFNTSVEF